MSFNFDTELSIAISEYEFRFGERDKRFQFLPVDFHALPYAQTLVDETNLTVSVRLDVAAKHDDRRLKFQIWHEAIHCLAPTASMRTLWFEEGLAVNSSMYSPSMNRQYRKECAAYLKKLPEWNEPWQTFRKLNAEDGHIREIHEKAPHRKFDFITPPLIVAVFGVSRFIADRLCQRLPETRSSDGKRF